MKNFLFAFFLLCAYQFGYGQNKLDSLALTIEEDKTLMQFFSEVEKTGAFRFYYLSDWVGHVTVSKSYSGLTLRNILNKVLINSDIDYLLIDNYSVVLIKDPSGGKMRDRFVETAKKNRVRVDEIEIGVYPGVPGKKVTLHGTIRDREQEIPLIGALIYVNGENIQTTSDEKGTYTVELSTGDYIMGYRYIDFEERIVRLSIYEDGSLNIDLDELPTTLNEVIISDKSISSSRVGESSIKMNDLSRTPTFLGEKDIIKQLQTQPGVTSVSEASSGFNVRGGGVDQNLVLYDGVPIFNTSHALGFFSAFNSDAIKEASFQKGGISAEFGGRVSSVLKMVSKEGDYNQWKGDFGIGLISSNVSLGGPIKKDTSSLNLSFRSTYSDWILNLLENSYSDIQNSSVFFFDGSAKYSQKTKNGGKLNFSSYFSQDKFTLSNDTINSWRNLVVSMRYDDKLSENLFYSAGLYIGNYTFSLEKEEPSTAFKLKYGVFFPSIKLDFNWDRPLNKIAFGFHSTFYNFMPGDLKPTSQQSNSKSTEMPDENALESAFYISDNFDIGDRFHVEAGIRLSLYSRIGPAKVYQYASDSPKEPYSVIDSLSYHSGETVKMYIGPEPRFSLRFIVDLHSSIKVGYNRMYQYIHLISNTALVTPVDIWQASDTYFKPQISDQISIGYFRNTKNGMYEFSLEFYNKYTQNILDFKDGANLILNPKLETALLTGIGKSYGVEFAFTKIKGRLTAGINYTYSRSFRKVAGDFKSEVINNGNYYPANYDQPHILNVNWRFGITRKIFFSGTFLYHTGRPISFPVAAYEVNHVPVIDFSDRNNFRIPDYHRLDLALVIEGSNKKDKRIRSQWAISVYNIYGRKNPYSAFFSYDSGGSINAYQVALVGVPVPSISYGLKF